MNKQDHSMMIVMAILFVVGAVLFVLGTAFNIRMFFFMQNPWPTCLFFLMMLLGAGICAISGSAWWGLYKRNR